MNEFRTSREAKEFLISGIVEEAQQEKVALSDLERKMLYFSETGWTLPDMMAVNEQFEREYDDATYEKKIARLIRNKARRLRKRSPREFHHWLLAIHRLSEEDHYILVMFHRAGISTGAVRDVWKTAIFGLIGICVLIVLGWLAHFVEWSTCGRFGIWYSHMGGCSVSINDNLSQIVGYVYLCLVALTICSWAYAHFDSQRRLYRIFDRIFPHPTIRQPKGPDQTA